MQNHISKKESVSQTNNLQRKKQAKAKANPVQRMPDLEEEDLLQGKFAEAFGEHDQQRSALPFKGTTHIQQHKQAEGIEQAIGPVVQRQIHWDVLWQKNLWSDQTKAAPFLPVQKFDAGETKYQMINVLKGAGAADVDIQEAIDANGISFDENLLDDITPWKKKGLLPDFGDPENQQKTEYRKDRRAGMTASGQYLMVGEGIHKSVGDPIPHITARIYKQQGVEDTEWQGRIHHSYHIRVQFNVGSNEWEFKSIQKMK